MTFPVGTDINHMYNRAAKLRAIIIAHLNDQDCECSTREIVEAIGPQLKVIGAKSAAVAYQLQTLSESNLIYRRNVASGYGVRFAKKAFIAKKSKQTTVSLFPDKVEDINLIVLSEPVGQVTVAGSVFVPKLLAAPQVVDVVTPNFTIDVVKETGKVRLCISGLMIEIGVI